MRSNALRHPGALFVFVGAMIGCWIALTPQGGGPDEVSHLVRAGGLARAQDGDPFEAGYVLHQLPDSYLLPDVTCWAFQPPEPASCAHVRSIGVTTDIPTRSQDYPVWSHLYAGVASRLPGLDPIWWARLANGLLATGLVGAALLTARDRSMAAAATVAALTPMAWFTFAIVNPSSTAVAGGVALWVGLFAGRDEDLLPGRATGRHPAPWLVAAGWAALALPRRDGLIWACLALAALLLFERRSFGSWWRSLTRGPQVLVAASTLATIVWGLRSGARVSQMVALAPLAIVAVELWTRARRSTAGALPRRAVLWLATVLGTLVATAVLVRARPGGWDGDLAGRIVGETGANLEEAIGRLGWLDTPLPHLAIVGWVTAIGLLVAASLVSDVDRALLALGVLATSVATAWLFELYQGNTTGTYWQGRYSLPILAGVPIVLGGARLRRDRARRIATVTVVGLLAIVNVAAVAAARRWGVGIDGSLAPWDWDTYRSPLPPVALLAIHLAASAALAAALVEPIEPPLRTPDADPVAVEAM